MKMIFQEFEKVLSHKGFNAWSNLMQEIPILEFTIKLWQDLLSRIVRRYSQQLLGTFVVPGIEAWQCEWDFVLLWFENPVEFIL